jgi:hypothetical protein
MPLGFKQLWPLGLLLLIGGSSPTLPSSPTPTRGPGEVPRVLTGSAMPDWFNERFGLALEALLPLGVPEIPLRQIALSIVAQWAHETGRGAAEFNFNLGGWRARKSDPYFVARDVQTGAELFRWTAYPDLPFAVTDQVNRLAKTFPSAWALLLASPGSSAWIEELGRRGYYTAKPSNYARAWAANRAELGGLAA